DEPQKKSGDSEEEDEPQKKSGDSEEEDEPQKEGGDSEEQNGVSHVSSAEKKNTVLLSSLTGKMNGVPTAPADILPYMSAWEKQWQRFCASHPILCPFDEAKDIYAVKMDLRDIRMLPRQYHSLANNSFLLHGYFNYRYLLFGHMDREERRWFIAVPGVFQNQEQLLAGVFGFTEFRTKHMTKQKTGEFGFWYRCLEL
ncbi:MAG: DUF6128 domain-containing protein, partial [Clostridiales bacterium]|nr:DUF6128 domain-containing protein [Clostridiales bacterium]